MPADLPNCPQLLPARDILQKNLLNTEKVKNIVNKLMLNDQQREKSSISQFLYRTFPLPITLRCHPLIAPDPHFQGLSSSGFLSPAFSCRTAILSC
jgi:hypothetical protein